MVESTGLENRHTLIAYLGFKSLSLRHYTESLQSNLQAFVKSLPGKLTGQVYPSSRAYFGDSFGAIQKTIPCITNFGDDAVVISKRLVAK